MAKAAGRGVTLARGPRCLIHTLAGGTRVRAGDGRLLRLFDQLVGGLGGQGVDVVVGRIGLGLEQIVVSAGSGMVAILRRRNRSGHRSQDCLKRRKR